MFDTQPIERPFLREWIEKKGRERRWSTRRSSFTHIFGVVDIPLVDLLYHDKWIRLEASSILHKRKLRDSIVLIYPQLLCSWTCHIGSTCTRGMPNRCFHSDCCMFYSLWGGFSSDNPYSVPSMFIFLFAYYNTCMSWHVVISRVFLVTCGREPTLSNIFMNPSLPFWNP